MVSEWFRVRCHLATRIVARTIAYPIRFFFFRASTRALAGIPWQEPPVRDGSVWHRCPRRVLQEQLRTLLIFSPSIQERAAGRRWRGPTVHGSGMAPGSQTVARTFAYLIQFFFRWIARPSSQQPGGTQCECCYHVRYGPTAVEGWLLTAIGPGPFRPRVWQVNPSRYRFDVAMFSSLEELSCKLREARTSSIG